MLPMRRLLAAVLKSLGVGMTITANDGEEGLRKVMEYSPDIILTDWLMQPLDGLEMTKRIRRQTSFNNKRFVPIIMITGYTAEHRIREARDAGVTEILVKPFTAGDLAKRLAHVINRPRDFIDAPGFFGPDRRRRFDVNFKGPFRRATDGQESWEIDVN